MSSNKISVILVSGELERLQMAAMVASVGAVSGNEVSVFVSMNALRHFVKGSERPPAEGAFGELIQTKGVPPFKQLFDQAVELGGAKILPCSMAMDLLGVDQAQLEPFVGEATGLTVFLADGQGGQILSF